MPPTGGRDQANEGGSLTELGWPYAPYGGDHYLAVANAW